ncbi:hypothetical protein WMY93_024151 [Mugilogobius chulae]|uniref:Alkylated DNA repair protein AlkB homologue 8 N-terminal domain-containing protein n=1 Tax=Mugilogobius chulae TaxID=88201 RepID=A0AAW0NB72_9GOBI
MHQTQLNINGSTVERVPTYKYLGVNIAEDMKWDQHISSVVKKSRQRLYHLRKLRQFNISVELRRTFYCSTVESVLSGCLTVWYGNATERDKKALRRVVRCAERITGTTLLYPEELYKKSCVRRAQQIMADIHHPHHDLFQCALLPQTITLCCDWSAAALGLIRHCQWILKIAGERLTVDIFCPPLSLQAGKKLSIQTRHPYFSALLQLDMNFKDLASKSVVQLATH